MVKIVCIKEHRSFGINKPGDELFVINTDGYDPTFWKVIEDSTPGNTETEPEPEPELTPPEPAAEDSTPGNTETEPEPELELTPPEPAAEDSTPGNTETEPEPEPELTPPEPAAPATAEQKLTPPPVKASKAKK